VFDIIDARCNDEVLLCSVMLRLAKLKLIRGKLIYSKGD
jgi:hypothetical protein